MAAELFPEQKIGFSHPDIRIADSVPFLYEGEHGATVRGQTQAFTVRLGQMQLQGQVYNKAFVLEVDYAASEKAFAARLGPHTFGSFLHADYIEAAHAIAEKFSHEHGFNAATLLNSWPSPFRAVVWRAES